MPDRDWSSPPQRLGGGGTGRAAVLVMVTVVVLTSLGLSACGTAGLPTGSVSTGGATGPVLRVVAAENFWGSIATQLGGDRVHVMSIITNPNTDPHAYEPTAADARTLADAQVVIENGIGYDPWVPKLLAADGGHPTTLDVGTLLGVAPGGNPHRWYNPADVLAVVHALVGDFASLDPSDRSYFDRQEVRFTTVALRPYDSAVSAIKASHAGAPVGASESIFAMLAPALGLDLITPPSFLRAISEGTDVSAADKQIIDDQIRTHQIKIYVYNSQNVTPDIQVQLREVRAAHIPVATITETLEPAGATFQAWQTKQLLGIESALARADG